MEHSAVPASQYAEGRRPALSGPSVSARAFATIGELAEALPGVEAEMLRLTPGPGGCRLLLVALNGTVLHLVHSGIPHLTRATTHPSAVSVGFALAASAPILVNGEAAEEGRLVVHRPNADHLSADWGSSTIAYLTIPPSRLQRTIAGLTGGTAPEFGENCRILLPPPTALEALRKSVARIARAMEREAARFEEPAFRAAIEDSLITQVGRAWAEAAELTGKPPARSHLSRWQMIRQAERYLVDHLDAPVQMAELCEAAGVSERSLRYAFHEFYDLSPMRFLKLLRLHRTRHTLLEADSGCVTVHAVALRYGFWETGRFAVEYRRLFGESPSETLRSSLSCLRIRGIVTPRADRVLG